MMTTEERSARIKAGRAAAAAARRAREAAAAPQTAQAPRADRETVLRLAEEYRSWKAVREMASGDPTLRFVRDYASLQANQCATMAMAAVASMLEPVKGE